jgi:hypothetical protein
MAADPRGELATVAIRGFPIAVHLASVQHGEALVREFEIIVRGGGDQSDLPKRLLDIVQAVQARAGGLNAHAERAIDDAIARGDAEAQFDIVVPADVARGAPEFEALLDEVDDYCRDGALLTLETPPEVRAFRRWYLGEFTRQLNGEAPLTWRAWNARATR